MMSRSRIGACAAAFALLVAACGGSGGTTKSATPAARAESTTLATALPATAATSSQSATASAVRVAPTAAASATVVPRSATTAPPTLAPISGPSGAGPTVVVGAVADAAMQYYEITGATSGELRDSINARGPLDSSGRRNDALTTWNIDWTWPLNPDSSCILSGATISTTITVTFPRWLPPAGAPASLIQQWNTYEAALVTHESGHVSFVVATAPEVLAAIQGATCAAAEAAAQAAVGRIRQHDIDYDAETNHGFTQGAHFP